MIVTQHSRLVLQRNTVLAIVVDTIMWATAETRNCRQGLKTDWKLTIFIARNYRHNAFSRFISSADVEWVYNVHEPNLNRKTNR